MGQIAIIDSHIHLWPEETSNEDGHSWMKPGMLLSKPHLLEGYYRASSQDQSFNHDIVVKGVVYIETDVRYDASNGNVATWAKGPLDEITFLRDMIEDKYNDIASTFLLGLVPWAPLDQPTNVLEVYLRLAEERAGPTVWRRVKGFRFLLQAILDRSKFESIVHSNSFLTNLKLLGKQGFSFDVGVDQRSGGSWQLDGVAKAMEDAHAGVSENEKVIFIVNHLCKPDFTARSNDFKRWCDATSRMSKCSKTYMKLSGAFSELPPELKTASDVAAHMRPWLKHVFQTFGPRRIMFGSDWPVCNVKGLKGEDSWVAWKEVIKLVLADDAYDLAQVDCNHIWHDTSVQAYRLLLSNASEHLDHQ